MCDTLVRQHKAFVRRPRRPHPQVVEPEPAAGAPPQEERNFGRAVGDRALRRAPSFGADTHRIVGSNDDEPGQLALDQWFWKSLADDGKRDAVDRLRMSMNNPQGGDEVAATIGVEPSRALLVLE